jgi:hypothetical protein
MITDEFFKLIQPEIFLAWFKDSLKEADITSVESLKDDEKLNIASQKLYGKIPDSPYGFLVKTFLSEKDLFGFMGNLRTRLLANSSLDLKNINTDYLKSIVFKMIADGNK